MKKYFILIIVLSTAIIACNHTHEKDDHDHENCSGHDHETDNHEDATILESVNAVAFTKEQQAKIDFATEEIQPVPFGQIIRTTAQIQPSQGDERIISAKTSGIVVFPSAITEGKAIGAEQTLLFIDGSATTDNNLAVRYAQAESEYNRAKAEYERKSALAKNDIVSQSELLQAKTEFTNVEANYNNLRRNFSAGKQSVSSPMNGFVTRVLVRNGQFVEAGQAVLVVSQNQNLFIKADVQPRFFDLLGKITSANIRILNSDRVYTLEELGGKLLSYGKSADVNNPLISVTFSVETWRAASSFEQETRRTTSLLPGSFVELFIKTQTNAQALTVPNEAIIEEMGNHFVFVQLAPEFFEKQFVEIGVTDGLRTEIVKGISANDRIVSKGAIFVKLAQASGALDPHAGHAH